MLIFICIVLIFPLYENRIIIKILHNSISLYNDELFEIIGSK